MAQGNTETDKYTAFALTILIAGCRVQNGHVLILAVIRIYSPVVEHQNPATRNAVVMDTLYAVVKQLPR